MTGCGRSEVGSWENHVTAGTWVSMGLEGLRKRGKLIREAAVAMTRKSPLGKREREMEGGRALPSAITHLEI